MKLQFNNTIFEELKEGILLEEFGQKRIFNFLNAYSVYLFKKHKRFRMDISNKNNLNFPDGFTVACALSILNFKKIKRIKGPDFAFKFLSDKDLNKNKKHLFVGLDKNSSQKIQKKFKFLELKNIFYHDVPFIKSKKYDDSDLIKKIRILKPDYIWVGLGNPKQEILSNDIYEKINKGLIFNVGAAFDYIKDKKSKAPKFFENVGLEWFYRMITDFSHTFPKVIKSFIGQFYLFFIVRLVK
jgi:exopolysaccharide biosynthesis WecB/TagA/CpsF family protein